MNLHFTKEWIERAAELEGDHEIGAGFEICDAPPGFIRAYFNATNQGEVAMTTDVKVRTNGNYVAMVKIDGEDKGTVGPSKITAAGSGGPESKQFYIPHGGVHTVEIEERAATPEEIEAAKSPPI
jgi:hypothetical protein